MSILINNHSTLFKHGSKHRNSGYKPFLFNYPSSLSSSFSPLPLTMTLLFNDLIQYLPPSIHNLSINDPRTYEWYLVSRLIASPGRSFDVVSTACRSIISACTRSLTKSGGKLCLHAVTWVIGIPRRLFERKYIHEICVYLTSCIYRICNGKSRKSDVINRFARIGLHIYTW